MTDWDGGAAARLRDLADGLDGRGATTVLRRRVQETWRRNLDWHDEQEGDTNRSLGVHCSENIRSLLTRDCAGEDAPGRRAGLSAASVDGSLQLVVAGIRLAVMKAPGSAAGRVPDWGAFRWQQHSAVRLAAAERNTRAYRPTDTDQPGRQLSMPDGDDGAAATSCLRDVLLVWNGDLRTAATTGWLTFPSTGQPPFFAVRPLWRDEGTTGTGRDRDAPSGEGPLSYDTLRTVEPVVRLRQRRADGGAPSRA